MVNELKSERSSSYDYLQKDTPGGGDAENSERDEESHGSQSDGGVQDGSQRHVSGSMQTEEAEALLNTSPTDEVNQASMIVRQSMTVDELQNNLQQSSDFAAIQMVVIEEEDKQNAKEDGPADGDDKKSDKSSSSSDSEENQPDSSGH